MSDEIAKKMMDLFAGLSSAHGTHGVPVFDENSGKWAIKTTARTLREPVTLDLWKQHLAGERPLGIVPIREDSMCKHGSIDVDEYREDLIDIVKKIEQRRLPLVPCRSKSGGLHLFVFYRDWVEAERAQAIEREVAASLGLAGCEIFPKQTQVKADRGDVGNWMVMPYFGGTFDGKLKEQVGIKHTGAEMSIKEFFIVAEERATTVEDLSACVKKSGTKSAPKKEANGADHGPFWDGPPCLRHLASIGVPEGGRNITVFNWATYYKKKYPEVWRTKVEEANSHYLQDPLPADEIAAMLKMHEKKTYEYQCKVEPLVSHCNSAKCRGCKFGIGNTSNYPVIHAITRVTSTPVIFFVEVPGGKLELTSEQLTSFSQFNLACVEQLNVFFSPLKQTEWNALVNQALTESETVKPKEDLTLEGRFHEALEDFLTNNQRGERREDLLTGRPYEDVVSAKYFFRIQDLDHHLTKRLDFRDDKGYRLTRNRMAKFVEKLEGEPHGFSIRIGANQKYCRCWSIPSDKVTKTPEYEAPDRKESI